MEQKNKKKLIIFPISDIHLEFRKNKVKTFAVFLPQPDTNDLKQYEPCETCLLIAGDLGYPSHAIYSDFLNLCKQKFNHVILTSGNHEYYKQKGTFVSTQVIDDKIHEVCKETGCVYLQKSTTSISLQNRTVTFAGCTLWSFIPAHQQSIVEMNMNDFSHLMTPNFKFWRSKEFNETHIDHLAWLKNILSKETIDVVITHHLPTFDLISPSFKNSDVNCCYASDSLKELNYHDLKFWVCGHSHEFTEKTIDQTTFITNPLGYPGEKTGYIKNKYFVI